MIRTIENTSVSDYFRLVKKNAVTEKLQAEIAEILPKDKSILELWKSYLQLKILQIAKIYEDKRDLNIEIKLQQRTAQLEKLYAEKSNENTAKSLEFWVLFVEQFYKFKVERKQMKMFEFCIKTAEADRQIREINRQINESKSNTNAR